MRIKISGITLIGAVLLSVNIVYGDGTLHDGELVMTFDDGPNGLGTPMSAERTDNFIFTMSAGNSDVRTISRYFLDGRLDTIFFTGNNGYRSIFQDNAGNLFGKALLHRLFSISGNGKETFLFDLENVAGGSFQDSVDFNADDTELFTRHGNTVHRHSATDGSFLGEITLGGMSNEEINGFPDRIQMETTVDGRFLTYSDGVVSEWDLDEGARLGTANIPIETPFGFESTWSFAVDGEGLIYLFNENTIQWEVYDIGLAPDIPCPWDLTGDGVVGVDDLLIVVQNFGQCEGECPADFDEDGDVDVSDLLALIANFGECPGAGCPWDVNGDGVVDREDVHAVNDNLGPCKDPDDCPWDVNGDGVVNGTDVSEVASHFGPCPKE